MECVAAAVQDPDTLSPLVMELLLLVLVTVMDAPVVDPEALMVFVVLVLVMGMANSRPACVAAVQSFRVTHVRHPAWL